MNYRGAINPKLRDHLGPTNDNFHDNDVHSMSRSFNGNFRNEIIDVAPVSHDRILDNTKAVTKKSNGRTNIMEDLENLKDDKF